MGMHEDLFWEIITDVESKGLRKEFDEQVKKMNTQEKHRYKEIRDRWSYAYEKILIKYNKS